MKTEIFDGGSQKDIEKAAKILKSVFNLFTDSLHVSSKVAKTNKCDKVLYVKYNKLVIAVSILAYLRRFVKRF